MGGAQASILIERFASYTVNIVIRLFKMIIYNSKSLLISYTHTVKLKLPLDTAENGVIKKKSINIKIDQCMNFLTIRKFKQKKRKVRTYRS